jgi:hypothetical protein
LVVVLCVTAVTLLLARKTHKNQISLSKQQVKPEIKAGVTLLIAPVVNGLLAKRKPVVTLWKLTAVT